MVFAVNCTCCCYCRVGGVYKFPDLTVVVSDKKAGGPDRVD